MQYVQVIRSIRTLYNCHKVAWKYNTTPWHAYNIGMPPAQTVWFCISGCLAAIIKSTYTAYDLMYCIVNVL